MQTFWISKITLAWILALAGGVSVLFLAQSADALYVLAPIVLSFWILTWFILTLWKRDRELPVIDIGTFCVIYTTLYTVVPLLNFYFGGLSFGILSDGRLQRYRPDAIELGLFFVHHIVYLSSLTAAYLLFRKPNGMLPYYDLILPSPLLVKVMVSVFIVLTFYFVALKFSCGIGFRSGYGDESQILKGSLLLQQINGKLSELKYFIMVSLLGFLVLRKNNGMIRYFLFLVIGWNILMAVIQPGSRGFLFSLILLCIMFWHKFHGIRYQFFIAFIPLVFLAFIFLGIYRSFFYFGNTGDFFTILNNFPVIASATNEFQALLGTAFDVKKILEQGADVPPILYFNDFSPMLPPQQLIPFQKLSGADWYLIQIGQYGTGVGFMWSVISQSLIGFGLAELAVRGLLLGWFLSFIHRWYQRRYTKFLPSVIYIYLCLGTMLTFRDTTGAVLWQIWWIIIPFTFFLYVLRLRSGLSRVRFNRLTSPRLTEEIPRSC